MAGYNQTSLAALIKTRYADKAWVEHMVFKERPFLAQLARNEKMTGDSFVVPVIYEDPQSISADFATAQAAAASASAQATKFVMTRVNQFGVVTIDGETIDAADGNEGSFVKAITEASDGIMRAQTTRLAVGIFRKGWGAVGQVSGTPGASTTLTLTNKRDIVNFAVGQALQFSSAETGATLRDSAKSLSVSAINRSAGTLTLSANLNTVSGCADQDYIFTKGDRHDSASTVRKMVAGLDDWLPYTAPDSTAFFGVDRTADLVRLSGVRYDGSSSSIEDALTDLVAEVALQGGQPTEIYTNPLQVTNLAKAMQTRVVYSDVSVGKLSFRGVVLQTEYGDVKVFGDRFCPSNRAYAITPRTWKLGSIGQVPKVLDRDGNIFFRSATADADEIRIGYRGNLYCNAPGWNGVANLASP